jgi:hypothetical protein
MFYFKIPKKIINKFNPKEIANCIPIILANNRIKFPISQTKLLLKNINSHTIKNKPQ